MSRNANGRFSELPKANISRSTFDRSASIKTTFNAGDLIPFYVEEVLPGDTHQIDTSKVVRLQTPLTPFMDNLFVDTYYFFVPSRLCWQHWVNLMGENTESSWVSDVEYSVPQITAPSGGWTIGTIADYMGIPTGISGLSVNALPFRAYSLIVNEWFRDQNLQDPLNINLGDATQAGSNGDNYITDCALGGKPFIAGKMHDYFTSCLPAPQKGPDVELPLLADGYAPVISRDAYVPAGSSTANPAFRISSTSGIDTFSVWTPVQGSNPVNQGDGFFDYESDSFWSPANSTAGENFDVLNNRSWSFSNLWAYVGSGAAASINQLRLAFQTQKYFEKLARGGSRYIEMLKTMFGVTNPDYRLQRPEYLGGNRIPISVSQVIQNSQTTESSPQGSTTGQSLTTDVHSDFTKSFTEHGYIIGVMVARYRHTYQQGLHRLWSRKSALDFYNPVFANIGEQAVLNKEIFAQAS